MVKSDTKVKVGSLWDGVADSIKISDYDNAVSNGEKILLFGETGCGKTTFYLTILSYLKSIGYPKEKLCMQIIFPDRPSGLKKLIGLIPEEYKDNIDVYPVTDYESSIIATATAERKLKKHYQKTGELGWMVFELMENYWSFSQDYYCRQAYGKSMGEYFAQMQSILSKNKAEKKQAYEAFAGPFGGPWVVIKFFHNFNWIDKVKRFPYNTVFTSEIKEESNKDSVFFELGFRPAGEKNNQHKMDTILYLGHKKGKFTMKPFKLTGFSKFYSEIDISSKNGYNKHLQACDKLTEMGLSVTKFDDLEQKIGIMPPKYNKNKKEEIKEKYVDKKQDNNDFDDFEF